jgi:hypothetical protein
MADMRAVHKKKNPKPADSAKKTTGFGHNKSRAMIGDFSGRFKPKERCGVVFFLRFFRMEGQIV